MKEQTIVYLTFLVPLPIFIFLFRTSSIYSFLLLPFWIMVPTILQLYLQSRELTVYKKAQILCWLKLAGEHNFTPEERDIINRALGETRKKVIRERKTWIRKHWMKMLTLLIFVISVVVVLVPIG